MSLNRIIARGRVAAAVWLTGILMLSGCGGNPSGPTSAESASEDMTGTTLEAVTAAPAVEEEQKLSTETARVGICLSDDSGGDNERLLNELERTMIQQGFAEENLVISEMTRSRSAQRRSVEDCLADGCSLLIVSAVSDARIGEIADMVHEAGAAVLFVNCQPGEDEIQRWKEEQINAVWLGSTYSQHLACQMSILYDWSGTERGLDFNGDGHIGTLLIGGGEEARGVLEETIRDLGLDLQILGEMEEGSADEISSYTEEIINEYRKDTELVLCSSEETLAAAADGVQLRHRLVGRDILVIGTGAHEDTCTGIINKLISGSTFTDFYEQANLAAVAARDMIEGNQREKTISDVIFKVTEENAQEVLDQLWKTKKDNGSREEGED